MRFSAPALAAALLLPLPLAAQTAAGTACEVRPGEGSPVGALWTAARRALDATRQTSASGDYRFRVRGFSRDILDRAGTVANDTVADRELMATQPYLPVSPDTVAARGFVMQNGDEIVYNLPDAAILLSDRFLDTHCFRMADAGGRTGEVGLAFEPTPGRTLPDVRGVFWLATEPLRLRAVEFEFTDPPLRGRPGTPGGAVDFRALPTGRWIVSRWRLRMPLRVETARALVQALATGAGARPGTAEGVREIGGEVAGVYTSAGVAVAMEPGATLAGVVWDSVAGGPLRGARVSLDGTQYATETDADGRFVLRDLPEGTFGVLLRAPRLDSLAYAPGPEPVVLARGQTASLSLAVPPRARLAGAACGEPAEGMASVSGTVRSPGGVPVAGARVIAAWGEGAAHTQRETASGPTGLYRLCGVPAGVPVSVTAVGAEGTAASSDLRLASGAPQSHDLTLRGGGSGPQAAPGVLALRVLSGAVSGRGVAGVRVSIEGTERRTTTDAQGMAAFTGMAPGRYTVVVEPPAGGRFTQSVTVAQGGLALQLAMTEREGVYALAPVVAAARSEAREAERRRGANTTLVTRDRIAEYDDRGSDVMGMMRGFVPSIHISYVTGRGGRLIPCLGGSRGATSIIDHNPCNVNIVIDGIRMGSVQGAELLMTMQPADIESFEFLNSIEGALRFGTGRIGESSAWLVIYTRNMGPHRQRAGRN